jgi:hypothetical protein
MSKRPATDDVLTTEASHQRKRLRTEILLDLSRLPPNVRARIATSSASVRQLLRFLQTDRLGASLITPALQVLVKRDILFPMLTLSPLPPPLRPSSALTFRRLWDLQGMEPRLYGESDDAFKLRVLAPTYLGAMCDVAAGMIHTLRDLCLRVDAFLDDVFYEASLSIGGGATLASFAFEKTADGFLFARFYLEDDGAEDVVLVSSTAPFQAAMAEVANPARALIDRDPALMRPLETMLLHLLLRVSPRLTLNVPVFDPEGSSLGIMEGRVSVATWGQLYLVPPVQTSLSDSDPSGGGGGDDDDDFEDNDEDRT